MNVTIIGTGNMARGIGHRVVAGGHSVTLVSRDPEAALTLANELRAKAKGNSLVQTSTLEKVEPGEVVVFALWYGVTQDVAKQLGAKLENRVVVDIANPLNATYDDLATAAYSSSAEELAKVVPGSAKVVKAFNTTFAGTLVNGTVAGIPLDVLIAGDDEAAKQTLSQIINDGGLVAVDAGSLKQARLLESLGLLGITLQMKHNLGFGTSWNLTHPN